MNESKTTGVVHLIGAGPGDPDLITVRGKTAVEQCDALVYDALVHPDVITWARPGCEKIFVGKRAGRHSVSQDQIQSILISLARSGKSVVRLKGGDPFVFGRGGEEAQALHAANVRFTIVPAVTAAVAASAFGGAPLTHRDHSSAVTFLSGHEKTESGGFSVDWKAHARTGATLCLYMAMGNLARIAEELEAGGMTADTPVLIVRWASTREHRQLRTTLKKAAADAEAAGLGAPALVIVGEVARLADELAWFSPDMAAAGGSLGHAHLLPG